VPANSGYDHLNVYDMNGRCIKTYKVNGTTIEDHLVPGFYLFNAMYADGHTAYKDKLVVY